LPSPPANPGLVELSAQGRGLDALTGALKGVPLEQDHHLLRVFGVSEDARPEAPGGLPAVGVCVEDLPPTSVISDLVPLEQVGHGPCPPSQPAPVRINLWACWSGCYAASSRATSFRDMPSYHSTNRECIAPTTENRKGHTTPERSGFPARVKRAADTRLPAVRVSRTLDFVTLGRR
jgi:hypothetical protein